MKLNTEGYRLIMKHEGLKLKPYLCPAKVPTIGYGNTFYENGTKVTMEDPEITKARAEELFRFTADRFAIKVARLITTQVTQNQFNSLVSFSYNVGLANLMKSTLLKKVNADPNDPSIPQEFMKWNKAGGKVLKGLTTRRQDEATHYMNISSN